LAKPCRLLFAGRPMPHLRLPPTDVETEEPFFATD
jgi:hypothetical protein